VIWFIFGLIECTMVQKVGCRAVIANAGAVIVGLVVEKVALEQIFLRLH